MTFEDAMAARQLLFEEKVGSGVRAEIAREEATAAETAAALKRQENQ